MYNSVFSKMSKLPQREVNLEVNLPDKGFRKTLYFNRVRVDRDDGFYFVQFGLVVATDLVDSYSCVLRPLRNVFERMI